jgi:hypothetical protein
MIDTATGIVTLSITGETIGPALTRRAFLESRVGSSASTGATTDARMKYEVKLAAGEIGQSAFHASLYFHDDQLDAVFLSDDSPEFSLWTTHGEVVRKAAHDDWLRAQGVAVGTYPWGKLLSELDDRAGGSYVAFIYRSRKEDRMQV